MCIYQGDTSYPVVLKQDLTMQIPSLKKQFLKNKDYQGKKIDQIFESAVLNQSVVLEARYLENAIAINEGIESFRLKKLPIEAQFAPIFAILAEDFDNDGQKEIITGGNFSHSKPEVGSYLSSFGVLMDMDGENLEVTDQKDSGLCIKSEIRDLEVIKINGKMHLLVGINDGNLQVLAY